MQVISLKLSCHDHSCLDDRLDNWLWLGLRLDYNLNWLRLWHWLHKYLCCRLFERDDSLWKDAISVMIENNFSKLKSLLASVVEESKLNLFRLSVNLWELNSMPVPHSEV